MDPFPADPTIHVAIAYHSGTGRTARQADAVARGAHSISGSIVTLHDVSVLDDALWRDLDAADAIIFGTPTYMGSPSSVFKAFAEATAAVWLDNMRWRDKIASGFTNSQAISGDKLNSLIDLAILATQHGMHWVGLDIYPSQNSSSGSIDALNQLGSWLGAMAQSPGDAGPDEAPRAGDLETAAHLGRRVALVTQRWVRGAATAAAVPAMATASHG
jgi:NAD(P)H dehydrogenase (quinone)